METIVKFYYRKAGPINKFDYYGDNFFTKSELEPDETFGQFIDEYISRMPQNKATTILRLGDKFFFTS